MEEEKEGREEEEGRKEGMEGRVKEGVEEMKE